MPTDINSQDVGVVDKYEYLETIVHTKLNGNENLTNVYTLFATSR